MSRSSAARISTPPTCVVHSRRQHTLRETTRLLYAWGTRKGQRPHGKGFAVNRPRQRSYDKLWPANRRLPWAKDGPWQNKATDSLRAMVTFILSWTYALRHVLEQQLTTKIWSSSCAKGAAHVKDQLFVVCPRNDTRQRGFLRHQVWPLSCALDTGHDKAAIFFCFCYFVYCTSLKNKIKNITSTS
jgi:hypothetical protein